ncbi:MAG: response regulator, partial [Chloroflexi bacterium]
MTLKPKILIVDDDKFLRKTLTDILRAKGFDPIPVSTGQLALAQVEQAAPAVALIDLQLDDISGIELMARIKAQAAPTECIILTGHASQNSAIEAINLGAYSYMQKPYDMDRLLLTIQRAVETHNTAVLLEQRAAQLLLINDIGRQIAAELDLESVLNRSVQLLHQKFGYHHVSIFTLDAANQEIEMQACAGLYVDIFPKKHRIKLGRGINGWVAQNGQRLLANDTAAEPRYVNFFPNVIPTRSELSVPISAGGKLLGVLDVQSPHKNAFT